MLTNGRSHVIFVIRFVSLVRCVGVRVRLLFCIPQVTVARLLCWSAPGVVGGVVAGLNTWRCWWFVSVLGGGGGADCWTGRRDDTDMDNRPAGEVRLGGGSDEVWRESCVITCIYRNSPWTCIGDPLYSNKFPNPPLLCVSPLVPTIWIAITFQEHAFQVAKPFPESLPDDPENVPENISTCQDDHFRDSDLGTTLSTGS